MSCCLDITEICSSHCVHCQEFTNYCKYNINVTVCLLKYIEMYNIAQFHDK